MKIAQSGTAFLSALMALQHHGILRHITFVVAPIALPKTRDKVMSSSAKEPSHPRIFVLHENTPWVEPLRREFVAIDAPFAEWFLDRGLVDLKSAPPRESSTTA